MSRRHRRSFGEAFVVHPLELRRSPAWRALPDNGRRVLDRLEIEHMEHGGAENGALKCTYSQFAAAGLRRASVALAICQCVALGFLEVSQRGSRSISNERWPSLYRLTYLVGRRHSPEPTHEWRDVRDDEDAAERLDMAATDRNASTQPSSKYKKPDAKKSPAPDAEMRLQNAIAGRACAPMTL